MHKYLLACLCALALVAGEFTALRVLHLTPWTWSKAEGAAIEATGGGRDGEREGKAAAGHTVDESDVVIRGAQPSPQSAPGVAAQGDVTDRELGETGVEVRAVSEKPARGVRKASREPPYGARAVRGRVSSGGSSAPTATDTVRRGGVAGGAKGSTTERAKRSGSLLGRTIKKIGGVFND